MVSTLCQAGVRGGSAALACSLCLAWVVAAPAPVEAQGYPTAVRAWGENGRGQLGNGYVWGPVATRVNRLANVSAIAASTLGQHVVAVTSDGRVWQWGTLYGSRTVLSEPTLVGGLSNVVAVAASGEQNGHKLALQADGTVWAWGNNSDGQLGDGTTTGRASPARVKGLSGVTAIAAGRSYSLALRTDGTVWAWGLNSSRQPGGTTGNALLPVAVPNLSNATAISAAHYRSVALLDDGTVWQWNYGADTVPVEKPGISNVTAIAAGTFFTLALKADGTVWAWGDNRFGQLGDGTTARRAEPGPVTGLSGVVAIAAGLYHALAVKEDGSAWAWGNNRDGELGNESAGVNSPLPVPVALADVTGVAAAWGSSFGLREDGTLWAWGDNYYGQRGNGTLGHHDAPVAVSDLKGVTTVSAGGRHGLALKADGTVWAWGDNSTGQTGDGTTTQRPTAVQVVGLADVVGVAAGHLHSLVVKSDGTVWAWGSNRSGQLGDGTFEDRHLPVQVVGLSGVQAVAAGRDHSLALKTDGTVWEWGWPEPTGSSNGRSVPLRIPGLNDVTAVATESRIPRSQVSLALRSDGGVAQWSASTPLSAVAITNVRAISTNAGRSIAVANDGDVWVWGEWCAYAGCQPVSPDGRPRRVEGITDATSVASFSDFVWNNTDMAVRSDGTVWRWDYSVGAGKTTELSTPVPMPGLAGATEVTLGAPASVASETFFLAVVHPVTRIAPDRGLPVGWAPVTIDGIFDPGPTSVTFGGVPALRVTVHGWSRLTVLAPPHPPGTVDVVVTTPSETTTVAGGFTYRSLVSEPPLPGQPAVPGDLDGDGATDAVVWRPKTGTWFALPSSASEDPYLTVQWGRASEGDIPVLGDFDGDAKADIAVWRPSTGTWFILQSSLGYSTAAHLAIQWGAASLGDVPVPADYDGDGITDPAVWRASTGTWYWLQSSNGFSRSAFGKVAWGVAALGDVPVTGDFDGDGKTDPAVWRTSTGKWYWLRSSDEYARSTSRAVPWGNASSGDVPVPADYDGDGITDPAVWRASTGTWYWLRSADEYDRGRPAHGNGGRRAIKRFPATGMATGKPTSSCGAARLECGSS